MSANDVRVAAHLIVGAREETFLPAALASLEGVADLLLVNENSGLTDTANQRALAASPFGRAGTLIVDPAPFEDFAAARNRVLALHRAHAPHAWAAFLDADEVHRPLARRIAQRLGALPAGVATVDAYVRHYAHSFDWYMTIERRMAFFRVTGALRWEGRVHEQLAGRAGRSLVLPYVYDHYGWLLPPRAHAAKAQTYIALGAGGGAHDEATAAAMTLDEYFVGTIERMIRFRGAPSPYVDAIRRRYEREEAGVLASLDAALARRQPPLVRARNALRALNYGYRWRGRALSPLARRLVR